MMTGAERNARRTGMIGIAAALLMFAGDMLLYFTTQPVVMDGSFAPYVDIMSRLPAWRLFLGGVLGPVSAFLYCIGYYHIAQAFGPARRKMGLLVFALYSLGIVVGGAYHAQFTLLGTVGKTGSDGAVAAVTDSISLLSSASMVPIAVASVLLAVYIVLGRTAYPRWFVLFTPLVLVLLQTPLSLLPQPLLIVLFGGWNNLLFVVFFAMSLWQLPKGLRRISAGANRGRKGALPAQSIR